MNRVLISRGRFLAAAAFFWIRLLAAIGLAAALLWAHFFGDFNSVRWIGGTGVAFLIGVIGFVVASADLCCPICRGPVFGRGKCSMHQKATRIFGSYSLPLSFRILTFAKRLRCKHCGNSYRFFGPSLQPEIERRRRREDPLAQMGANAKR